MKKFLFVAFMLVFSTALLSAKNVSVTVSPENAIVMQKGKVIQPVTPGVYNLTVGLKEVVYAVQADGYDSEQFILNLKSPAAMQVKLKPNRKQVSFSADPKTATIYVDGRELGKGVVDFSINKNETKTVKVEQDGYDTYIKQVGFNDQSDIKMSYNVTMEQNRREVNILVDAPAAEFRLNGLLVGKGKNTATITLHKGQDAELVIKAEGFLEYSRIMKFSENVSSYNLTQDMVVDPAYAASEPGADIANTSIVFTIGMAREDAIKRMLYYIRDNKFNSLENSDNLLGWYRTTWNVEKFNDQYIRTRVEIEEVPNFDDGPIKFKLIIHSQITTKKDANDEDYKVWNRILKKYATIPKDLRSLVGGK